MKRYEPAVLTDEYQYPNGGMKENNSGHWYAADEADTEISNLQKEVHEKDGQIIDLTDGRLKAEAEISNLREVIDLLNAALCDELTHDELCGLENIMTEYRKARR